MLFFYLFALLLLIMETRTLSYSMWCFKNKNILGGVALIVLAVLSGISGVLYVLA